MASFKNYLSLIKFSHTIFALPFALIGFFLASKEYGFEWHTLIYVLLCMLFARSAAMAFNRYIDRDIDLDNPRTAQVREIPNGTIKPQSALLFVIFNCLAFVVTTFFINLLCFYLSPIALLIILGYSYTKRFTALCHLVLGLGLSLAPLGAFLAGLLLSETEFRHQIETDIKPFKGILLGLFFVSVGMSIDFSEAISQYKMILLAVAGLFFIKGLIITIIVILFGISKDVAIRMGLLLGQAGEFGFVVIGIAKISGVISNEIALFMLIVVSMSMIATPFVSIFGKFISKVEKFWLGSFRN